MCIYGRMSNIGWQDHKSNDELWQELSVLQKIKQKKIRYFGHIKRRKSIRKNKLKAKIDGKRKEADHHKIVNTTSKTGQVNNMECAKE